MPTTTQENNTIFTVMSKYMQMNDLNDCLEELIERVAYNTDNYSVRKSIYTLYKLIYPSWSPPGYINICLEARWQKLKSDNCLMIYDIDLQSFIGLDDNEYEKHLSIKAAFDGILDHTRYSAAFNTNNKSN